MNAHNQKIIIHGERMRSNYRHRQVLDLDKREKLIRKDLESVFKSQGYFRPDSSGSG